MKVHFIGAGPGDPELLTLRGRRLIRSCPVVLFAGSLVPREVVAEAPPGARVLDTAPMDRPGLEREYARARDADESVARVHSGDPSLYGAITEQTEILRRLGVEWDITPGVPAFAAAAAALGRELTLPGVSQTVILTRSEGAASPMPPGESLARLGASGATIALHLGARRLRQAARELEPHYGADCPVALAWRVGWPDQALRRTRLDAMAEVARAEKWTRTLLALVGPALGDGAVAGAMESALYDPASAHVLRPGPRAKAKTKRLGAGGE